MNHLLILVVTIWLNESIAQCTTGLKLDRMYYDTPVLQEFRLSYLPAKISLKSYCPKPATQLNTLSSAGWSTAYYGMTILNSKTKGLKNIDQITEEAISPSYTQLIVQGAENIDCNKPISIKESLEVLVTKGSPTLLEFPHLCPENNSVAKLNRLSGFTRLFTLSDTYESKVYKIKTCLYQQLPIVIALKTSLSLCEAKTWWTPSNQTTEDSPLQAVCLVGYDENELGGSIELVNSWGSNWGNSGFIWVRYEDLIPRIAAAYVPYQLPERQEFSLSVSPRLGSGTLMAVKLKESNKYQFTNAYGSGNNFNFEINSTFKGYIYLFYYNERGENALLFPESDRRLSEVLPFDSSHVIIPAQNRYIELDTNPGMENIVIILSQEEINKNNIMQIIREPNVSLKAKKDTIHVSGTLNNRNSKAVIWMELNHI